MPFDNRTFISVRLYGKQVNLSEITQF